MPTLLEWLGLPTAAVPCDGHSLLPFLREGAGAGTTGAKRCITNSTSVTCFIPVRRSALGPGDGRMRAGGGAGRAVQVRSLRRRCQPLFFDLTRLTPAPAEQPGQAGGLRARVMLRYAQKMLDWRLLHAERTLTGYAASPEGLLSRL